MDAPGDGFTPDDGLDLDARERAVTAELGMLMKLAETGLRTSARSAQNTLQALVLKRPEAKFLADAGRPAQSERLEQIIVELEAALAKVQGIPATLARADAADAQLAAKYRAETGGIMKEPLAKDREGRQKRIDEARKNL